MASTGQRQEDAGHGTEPSTGRDAKDVRRDQRVAEHALVGGPGGGERGADGQGAQDPRQTDLPDHSGRGFGDAAPPPAIACQNRRAMSDSGTW